MPIIDAFIIDNMGRRQRKRPTVPAELPVELPVYDENRRRAPQPPPQGLPPDAEGPRPRGVMVLDT